MMFKLAKAFTILVVLFSLGCGRIWVAVTYTPSLLQQNGVQGLRTAQNGGGPAATLTATFSSNNVAGNFIVVGLGTSHPVTSITDSSLNSYILVTSATNGGSSYIYYARISLAELTLLQ